MAALLVFIAGGLLSLLEPQAVKAGFWSGVWWAVVTVTTVRYGDISPVTPVGRILGAVLMVVGIGLVATLAASIAAYFVGQDEGGQLDEIVERLDRMEALLRSQDRPREL